MELAQPAQAAVGNASLDLVHEKLDMGEALGKPRSVRATLRMPMETTTPSVRLSARTAGAKEGGRSEQEASEQRCHPHRNRWNCTLDQSQSSSHRSNKCRNTARTNSARCTHTASLLSFLDLSCTYHAHGMLRRTNRRCRLEDRTVRRTSKHPRYIDHAHCSCPCMPWTEKSRWFLERVTRA